MKGLYPISTTTDINGVTTNDFTDNQWAKEAVRRWVVKQVSRYETMVAKNAANVDPEDDIIT